MLARLRLGCVALTLAALLAPSSDSLVARTIQALPAQLTDREFMDLVTSLSEPAGSYPSENLVSNEVDYQKILPALVKRHAPGGVYLGVGPEQNFTYIANLEPRIAFIIDIRRGNRDLHLMYRALFELAETRADFVSLLFSIPRPSGLTEASTVAEIFAAFFQMKQSGDAYRANLARLLTLLRDTRRWLLSADDVHGVEAVYQNFYRFGLMISYESAQGPGAASVAALLKSQPGAYAALMRGTDARGEARSFLSSEDRYKVVRRLQIGNLIVPVVGDFAGPKTLRAIGDWLRARRAAVSAFYVSNVEDYLRGSAKWSAFCQNVASLPADASSDLVTTSNPAASRPSVSPPRAVSVADFTAGCRGAR
jgi:hypothetical protein